MTATLQPVAGSFAGVKGPLTVDILNPDLTVATADVKFVESTVNIDDGVSMTGVAKVTIGLDRADNVIPGNLLRFTITDPDTETAVRVFRAEIEEPIVRHLLHIDGAALEVAELSCRGDIAQLENVPILPYNGVDARPQATSRPMSWAAPEADLTSWSAATVLHDEVSAPWATPQTDPPWFQPWFPPKGFLDHTAKWIAASTPDPETGHPPGKRRFVRDVTISTEGWYQMQTAADDGVRFLVDGILAAEGAEDPGDTFILPIITPIYLSAGVHRFAWEVENYDKPATEAVGTFGGPNIMRLAWALYEMPDGAATVLTSGDLVAHSDANTKTIDSDDPPPAPTWGRILRAFFEEAPTDSPAGAWTLDFDDDVDSNGDPWTECGDQSFGVCDDTSLLSVIQQGATSGCIDWHPDPASQTLHVTNFGALGSNHDAVFNRSNGRLTDLTSTGIAGRVAGLVVRYNTGLTIVDDATTVEAIGTRRRSLALADLTRDAAIAEARRELNIRKLERASCTAAIQVRAGSADAPYGVDGWGPGDSPTFGDERMRAMRITTTVDANGNPVFVPELQTRLQGEAERQKIALAKAGATLDATSRSARPIEGIRSGIVSGFAKPLDPIVFTQIMLTPTGMEAAFDVSSTRKWEVNTARVHRIDLTQDVPPQEVDTIVLIKRANPGGTSTVATLTLPVGSFHTVVLPHYLHIGLLDQLYMVVDQHDTALNDPDDPEADARWLKVQVFAVDANPAAVTPRQTEVPW